VGGGTGGVYMAVTAVTTVRIQRQLNPITTVKVKVSPCLIKHLAMKTCGGMEV
jgi:hypothetical protein